MNLATKLRSRIILEPIMHIHKIYGLSRQPLECVLYGYMVIVISFSYTISFVLPPFLGASVFHFLEFLILFTKTICLTDIYQCAIPIANADNYCL